MKDEKMKASLRMWLTGFAALSLVVGLYYVPFESTRGIGVLALAFAVMEFLAVWSLRK